MPLRQTRYGGECPLDRFTIDVPAGCGCYTSDPVEACLKCHWGDKFVEGFDLEEVCKCPADMDWNVYDKLKDAYCKSKKPPYTSEEFREFALSELDK